MLPRKGQHTNRTARCESVVVDGTLVREAVRSENLERGEVKGNSRPALPRAWRASGLTRTIDIPAISWRTLTSLALRTSNSIATTTTPPRLSLSVRHYDCCTDVRKNHGTNRPSCSCPPCLHQRRNQRRRNSRRARELCPRRPTKRSNTTQQRRSANHGRYVKSENTGIQRTESCLNFQWLAHTNTIPQGPQNPPPLQTPSLPHTRQSPHPPRRPLQRQTRRPPQSARPRSPASNRPLQNQWRAPAPRKLPLRNRDQNEHRSQGDRQRHS